MKKYRIIFLILLFVLTIFLMLIIPNQYNIQIWTTVIFDIGAFASNLIVWSREVEDAKGKFYKYPALTISSVYLAIQIVFSIAVAIVSELISFKIVLIVNVILLALAWILIVFTLMSRDNIEKLDLRQKNHHTGF